ncbi:MAG: terpene cyclase/mutase family protein [Planctomycetes bacterium]|nr:terpene cyclase/mutase family protein [Planctomycetota bacterium]
MRPLLHGCLALFAAPMFMALACAQTPGKDRLSESVDRGLALLARIQEDDGAWKLEKKRHPAVTSLAVMAFLSAGHVPGEGPYRETIEKGIRSVLAAEQPSGLFAIPGQFEEMYTHGISTLMLCEAATMTDSKTARTIKPKLEKAVKLILQGQRTENSGHRGGWRYRLDSTDADMSVTGWQILALRSARNIGCDVPAERINLAMDYVQSCRDARSGGFTYTAGTAPSVACTGTGILALELCGKDRHHSREALLAGSFLLKTPIRNDDPHFFYAAYYTSQGMFQLGNNYWTIFRPQLHRLLLDRQQQNGGWIHNDINGTAYSTSMAILALTVEYRLLPIYQRDEEDADPKMDR